MGTHQSKPFAIMHVAARTYTIWCDGKQLRVPLPSAIFAMFGDNCYLFAKKEDSFAPTQTLFHFPLPNINSNGLICFGTYDKPASVTDTFNLFHQSSFNHHHVNEKSRKFPTDVRRLLSQLDGKKKFPLTDLISLDKTADEIFARYLAR